MNTELESPDDEDEDDEDALHIGGALTLLFTREGGAILEEDGEGVWYSDDDDEFHEQFGDDFLTADQDAKEVLEWLADHEQLEDDEKAHVAVQEECEDTDEDSDSRISHS